MSATLTPSPTTAADRARQHRSGTGQPARRPGTYRDRDGATAR